MSHVDPRMSWGHLVARLVRDAVARHDPRGGARGQRRRRSAGSAGASPRRAPIKTRAAGAEAGPVQPVGETSGRAPNKTRAAMTPAAPARRGGGGTPAPKGDTAATAGQNPVAMLASAAAPQQSAPAALADGALAGGVPSAAPAATAAPQFAGGVSADGSNADAGVPVSPGATSAPQLAADVSVDGSHPGAGAQVSPGATSAPPSAAGASADGSHPGAGAQVSPVATSAPQLAADVSVDGSHPGAGAPISPGATSAPQPAAGASADGSHAGAGAQVAPGATSAPQSAAGVSAHGSHAGAGAQVSPVATSAPHPVAGVSLTAAARSHSRSSGAHDPRTCSQPPPIPAAAPHSRGCPAPCLATRRWTLLLSRPALRAPLHLVPSAADRPPVARRPGRWPGAVQPQSPVRNSSQNAPRLRTGGSAGAPAVAPPPRCRHAARLRWPTACRWPAETHFAAPRAQRASSLPPLQTLAGRCRCAHAGRGRGLPVYDLGAALLGRPLHS